MPKNTPEDSDGLQKSVACPYCGTRDTELSSLFGQQLLTVQYYCHTCHTPFEHVKDDDVIAEVGVAHITTCA